MDPFVLISKLLGATARIGLAVFLAALILWLGRRAKIDFFTAIDPAFFSSFMVAGIVGACVVIADLIFALAEFGKKFFAMVLLPLWIENHNSKKMALKNLKSLTETQAMTFHYLKANNMKRFRGSSINELLRAMTSAALLKTDDTNTFGGSRQTYYVVPNYVWKSVDQYLPDTPAPERPPWENFERLY